LTSKLNDVQMKIIDFVLRQSRGNYMPPLAVFGAFGTGKTETLALAAMYLASQTSAKILIATHTNRSVCFTQVCTGLKITRSYLFDLSCVELR